jgi:hypothetical protein
MNTKKTKKGESIMNIKALKCTIMVLAIISSFILLTERSLAVPVEIANESPRTIGIICELAGKIVKKEQVKPGNSMTVNMPEKQVGLNTRAYEIKVSDEKDGDSGNFRITIDNDRQIIWGQFFSMRWYLHTLIRSTDGSQKDEVICFWEIQDPSGIQNHVLAKMSKKNGDVDLFPVFRKVEHERYYYMFTGDYYTPKESRTIKLVWK